MAKNREPTFLGTVSSVSGASVMIELLPHLKSGLVIIGGKSHRIGQVASFVRIPQGYSSLFGIISETSETSSMLDESENLTTKRRWVKVELVGEVIGNEFERGIGQYPSINDEAHIVVDEDLKVIYGDVADGQVVIGQLSSSENINVSVDIEKLVTRHSAVLGSTGSGKSTSVSSLLRSIACSDSEEIIYPSARIILIDIHGEYSKALGDIAKIFAINPRENEEKLFIPYWCVSPDSLIDFLCGQINERSKTSIAEKIYNMKIDFLSSNKENPKYKEVDILQITSQTPVPFNLKQLWYDLSFEDSVTWNEKEKKNPSVADVGSAANLVAPKFNPPGSGGAVPFKGGEGVIKRNLESFRIRMLDRQFSFLLNPGSWEPDSKNNINSDLDSLLELWLGHKKPITVLDLSGAPSSQLDLLLGSLLDILFETAVWGRNLKEGMKERPLLLVLEEAHRYLSNEFSGFAKDMVRRIVKEGRKFGLGVMLVSQRPSEIDETILSQCGTMFALRINNSTDRGKVKSAMSEGISGILDSLPVLKTGEAIVAGESAKLPMRCHFKLPKPGKYPDSHDPKVAQKWKKPLVEENYGELVLAWRNQDPFIGNK